MPTIDDVLVAARARYRRTAPVDAARELAEGTAVLVDIRPRAQRCSGGDIPGALVINRNVLEWRLDPASAARLPIAAYDLRVVVLCNEGYSSSLAASSLIDLGLAGASDVIGGFQAWRRAGLPVRRYRSGGWAPQPHRPP